MTASQQAAVRAGPGAKGIVGRMMLALGGAATAVMLALAGSQERDRCQEAQMQGSGVLALSSQAQAVVKMLEQVKMPSANTLCSVLVV